MADFGIDSPSNSSGSTTIGLRPLLSMMIGCGDVAMPYGGEKLLTRNWLGQVARDPEGERFLAEVACGGHEQHRNRRPIWSQHVFRTKLGPACTRYRRVEQDQSWRRVQREAIQGLPAIGRANDLIAGFAKGPRGCGQRDRVVVNDKDAGMVRHRRSPRPVMTRAPRAIDEFAGPA
jgi:hypothetical protein